jgi:hypothetical protein
MTVYIFDSSSFIVLGHYFPQRFPSFWKKFDAAVLKGEIKSVREVFNELKGLGNKPHLDTWIAENKKIFLVPAAAETEFVAQIFAVPHFQQIVSRQQRLKGNPVADPFVIAAARVCSGCVVTEEAKKPNAARIPNICEHFGISCNSIEGFLEAKGWKF